jgi:hypothetical protein
VFLLQNGREAKSLYLVDWLLYVRQSSIVTIYIYADCVAVYFFFFFLDRCCCCAWYCVLKC